MAIKDRQEMLDEADAMLLAIDNAVPDNTDAQISPEDVRTGFDLVVTLLRDLVDSVNKMRT